MSPTVLILAAELGWRFLRSSGPAGQNVNTTDSRVELVFDLPPALQARALRRLEGKLVDGTLMIANSEYYSQWQNRAAAQRRLAAKKQRSVLKGQRSGGFSCWRIKGLAEAGAQAKAPNAQRHRNQPRTSETLGHCLMGWT